MNDNFRTILWQNNKFFFEYALKIQKKSKGKNVRKDHYSTLLCFRGRSQWFKIRWIRFPNKCEVPLVSIEQWIILSRRTFSSCVRRRREARQRKSGRESDSVTDRPFFSREYWGREIVVSRDNLLYREISVEFYYLHLSYILRAVQREISGVTYTHNYTEIIPNEIAF